MSIRPATAADLPEMREIYRPFVERTAVSFEYQVPTPEEFSLRFTQHIAQFPWLVWEEQGRVLGYAYAGAPWERAAYRWCAESLSIWPRRPGEGAWGRPCTRLWRTSSAVKGTGRCMPWSPPTMRLPLISRSHWLCTPGLLSQLRI